MNYELTAVLAGIRTEKWFDIYESIKNATKRSFEMICVGPYPLPVELQNLPNVRFIKDFGSPNRCKQIGLVNSTGTYFTWVSDDAPFLPGTIDSMFDLLFSMPPSEKNVVSGKYYEGRQYAGSDELHVSKKYYYFGFHPALKEVRKVKHKLLFNIGIINTNYLKSLGGWDCNFEASMGDADLSVRIQLDGANMVLTPNCVATVDWHPGEEGDHGPVHNAHVEHDFPMFCDIYKSRTYMDRLRVPIDNWTKSPDRWPRRFKG